MASLFTIYIYFGFQDCMRHNLETEEKVCFFLCVCIRVCVCVCMYTCLVLLLILLKVIKFLGMCESEILKKK